MLIQRLRDILDRVTPETRVADLCERIRRAIELEEGARATVQTVGMIDGMAIEVEREAGVKGCR